jgi:hypothetical protein
MVGKRGSVSKRFSEDEPKRMDFQNEKSVGRMLLNFK